MAREYKLRSPGNAGGLVPLGGEQLAEGSRQSSEKKAPAAVPPKGGTPTAQRFAAGLPAAFAAPSAQRQENGPPAGRSKGALLSQAQKATIGSMASEAFIKAVAADPDWLPEMKLQGFTKSAVMEDWRHGQCKLATKDHPAGQISGLSKAGNEHFDCLLAHFANLAGHVGTAFKHGVKAAQPADQNGGTEEKKRQALWRLEQTMKKTGLGMGYVMTIVRNKHHKTSVDQLTAGQISQLCWTLNNRKNQKRYEAGDTDANARNKKQQEAYLKRKATPQEELPDNVLPFPRGN